MGERPRPERQRPEAGLQPDLGADLHVWTMRGDQIEEDRADAPGEALEEAADLLDEMFETLEVPTKAAEAPETEDVVRAREQVRDVVDRINRDLAVDAEDIASAFEEARGTFQLLVTGRHAGGGDAAL